MSAHAPLRRPGRKRHVAPLPGPKGMVIRLGLVDPFAIAFALLSDMPWRLWTICGAAAAGAVGQRQTLRN